MPITSTLKSMLPASLRQRLARLRNFVFLTDFQEILQLDPATLSPHSPPKGMDFVESSDARGLRDMHAIRPMHDAERRFAERRLAAGDALVIGRVDGIPAFFGWTSRQLELTFGVFVEPPGTDGEYLFCYNLFTAPAHRRKGLACAFYHWLAWREREAGASIRLLAGVANDNIRAAAMHRKAGFEPVGHCDTLRLFGIGFTRARLPAGVLDGRFLVSCAGHALRLA